MNMHQLLPQSMGALFMVSPAAHNWNSEFDLQQEELCLEEVVEWEKSLLRNSFTRACTNLTQRADASRPLFTPRNKKRLWVEIWIPYFQILLWNCEANYLYDNFSGCFSCRITDQKIIKAERERLLSSHERLAEGTGSVSRLQGVHAATCWATLLRHGRTPDWTKHPSWFLLPKNIQTAPESAQNMELIAGRYIPMDSLDSTQKRSGKPHI